MTKNTLAAREDTRTKISRVNVGKTGMIRAGDRGGTGASTQQENEIME
jgi:hypothetical protein